MESMRRNPKFYRWLMKVKLGRKLATEEVVHHINGDLRDNRLENLEVLRNDEHSSLHGKETARKQKWRKERACFQVRMRLLSLDKIDWRLLKMINLSEITRV